MPGLLQADAAHGAKLGAAVTAEFLGTLLFAFFGGAAPGSMAAWANGIALAVLGTSACVHVTVCVTTCVLVT